jgi:hypothetical protein
MSSQEPNVEVSSGGKQPISLTPQRGYTKAGNRYLIFTGYRCADIIFIISSVMLFVRFAVQYKKK